MDPTDNYTEINSNSLNFSQRVNQFFEGKLGFKRINVNPTQGVISLSMKDFTGLSLEEGSLKKHIEAKLLEQGDLNFQVHFYSENQIKIFDTTSFEAGLEKYLKDPSVQGDKLEAVKRIRTAFKEDSSDLDLRNLNLTSLPPELGKLQQLKRIILTNNQLKSLPPEIEKLTQLGTLVLSNNLFSSLPPVVVKLNNLNNLFISYNRLSSLPKEIGNLQNLAMLYVDNNQISTLPPEIGKLRSIRFLIFRNNPISSLPSELGDLNNLEDICEYNSESMEAIYNSSIKSGLEKWLNDPEVTGDKQAAVYRIHKAFISLSSELDLKDLKLSSLPPEIGELKTLKWLQLSNNRLKSLPAELAKLQNLKSLYVYDNILMTLTPEIAKLTKLESLDLGNNLLTSLPIELAHLQNLAYLDLNRNGLTGLPIEMGKLQNLQRLNLHSNMLNSLPKEMGELSQLRSIDLSRNPLSHISGDLGDLDKLQDLASVSQEFSKALNKSLFENGLKKWLNDPSASGNKQEAALRMQEAFNTGNPNLNLMNLNLNSLPPEIGLLQNLQSLFLSHNELSSLPAEIGNLKNLGKLHLSDNLLNTLPSEIGKLKYLRLLFFDNNPLNSLPCELGDLNNLKEISEFNIKSLEALYDSSIKSGLEKWLNDPEVTGDKQTAVSRIQHAFIGLSNELDLSDLKLSSLPPEIGELKTLKWLQLSNNRLKSLPAELAKLKNLKRLYANRNNLEILPPELGQLKKLESLGLEMNRLTALAPEIGELQALENLNLKYCGLAVLPAELEKLQNLKSLNLSGNSLTRLDGDVKDLTNLPHLASLSLEFAELFYASYIDKNLKTWLNDSSIQGNKAEAIRRIKSAFETKSTKLDLSNLGLTALPQEMLTLQYLKELNLEGNNLSSFPSEIASLQNLEILNFKNNQLSSLSDKLVWHSNLTHINLENNHFTSFPPELTYIPNLMFLDFQNNQLTSLPERIGNLSNLQTLNLENNQLTSLPERIGNLSNLRTLNLENNQLTSLPERIGNLSNLRTLNLENNPLELINDITTLIFLFKFTASNPELLNLINDSNAFVEPLLNMHAHILEGEAPAMIKAEYDSLKEAFSAEDQSAFLKYFSTMINFFPQVTTYVLQHHKDEIFDDIKDLGINISSLSKESRLSLLSLQSPDEIKALLDSVEDGEKAMWLESKVEFNGSLDSVSRTLHRVKQSNLGTDQSLGADLSAIIPPFLKEIPLKSLAAFASYKENHDTILAYLPHMDDTQRSVVLPLLDTAALMSYLENEKTNYQTDLLQFANMEAKEAYLKSDLMQNTNVDEWASDSAKKPDLLPEYTEEAFQTLMSQWAMPFSSLAQKFDTQDRFLKRLERVFLEYKPSESMKLLLREKISEQKQMLEKAKNNLTVFNEKIKALAPKSVVIDDKYIDFITREVMKHPHHLINNKEQNLDRSTWEMCNGKNPFNNQPFQMSDLLPDAALKDEIDALE
jgi:Leucine-rich repeat (LRR) protein